MPIPRSRRYVSQLVPNELQLQLQLEDWQPESNLTCGHVPEPLCPCLVLPESFTEALATMMDMSLLKNPVFLLIGISNVFGMAGLYVPFVYLVDAAKHDVSISIRT